MPLVCFPDAHQIVGEEIRKAVEPSIHETEGEAVPGEAVPREAQAQAMLPTDRLIAVYSYTGHTGGVATTVLNVLGYDAVNVEFGIMAWTLDPEVRGHAPFSEAADASNFPIETSVNLRKRFLP